MAARKRRGRPACGAEREIRTWVLDSTYKKIRILAAKRGVTVTRLTAAILADSIGTGKLEK